MKKYRFYIYRDTFFLALRYEAPLSYWQWSVSFGLTYLIYKAEK